MNCIHFLGHVNKYIMCYPDVPKQNIEESQESQYASGSHQADKSSTCSSSGTTDEYGR